MTDFFLYEKGNMASILMFDDHDPERRPVSYNSLKKDLQQNYWNRSLEILEMFAMGKIHEDGASSFHMPASAVRIILLNRIKEYFFQDEIHADI